MAASPFARIGRFLFVVAAAAGLAGCGINSIPTADEEAKAKWADVQNQYQRRADLIPNLVATVKGYATHEEKTLSEVTQARARATGVTLTADDLTDPAKMAAFQQAQGQLSQGLGRLMVAVEAYPDLKANQNFLALQSQLEGTENRISVARRDYNEAVRQYNTLIRTFPAIIGAKVIYGAKPMVPFQATTPGAEQAPTVSFDSAPAPAPAANDNTAQQPGQAAAN
ncbi:LemA family protein [Novosphingobium sp. ZN18A2]|uniref:LemA family protein n=1 Tax=Novosphingobium sp. ZN18A2 TaxID=3079861 RepID=UPI0030CAC0E3